MRKKSRTIILLVVSYTSFNEGEEEEEELNKEAFGFLSFLSSGAWFMYKCSVSIDGQLIPLFL